MTDRASCFRSDNKTNLFWPTNSPPSSVGNQRGNTHDDFIHNEEWTVASAHDALSAITGTDLLADVSMS